MKLLTIICGLLFTLSVTAIYIDATNKNEFIVDVGVVYGNKVELSGEPSSRLKSRLDAALKLYKENRIKVIFVSGGIGKEQFDEALVMKEYLLTQGVLTDHIIKDSKGNNTHLTNQNLLEQFPVTTTVAAISQKYHISRAKLSLRNSGFKTVYGYPADYSEWRDIYSYTREIPAWLKYKILGL